MLCRNSYFELHKQECHSRYFKTDAVNSIYYLLSSGVIVYIGKILHLMFLSTETFPDYHATLFIQNLNIEEILNVSMQEKLIDEFVPLWGQGSTVWIYGAMSAAELGLRNVVPINNEKQG